MKKQKHIFSVLFGCLSITAMQAQTYINTVNDMYHDDALVDMQYNITHLKPEALFKLGDGFNVLSFNENTGAVASSKFVIITGKKVVPKCIAQAGTQCFVFSEDATNIYYTSLNTATGAVAYTKSVVRALPTELYYDLSPVDAEYDGSGFLYALFSLRNTTSGAWNAMYFKINVNTGAIVSRSLFGINIYDFIPNDIEYANYAGDIHILISGSGRVHNTAIPFKPVLLRDLPYDTPLPTWNIFELPLTNNRPRSLYVNYRNGYIYLLGDSYHPSYMAAGPHYVLRLTDNNNGTVALNNQYLYGTPGANFFIHDVQEEYGVLIASGEFPSFISGGPVAPRNFLYNTLYNTAMMSEYQLGGNVNIRTVYSGISLRMFSVAKENNMALPMYEMRTDINATTLPISCEELLPLSISNESFSITSPSIVNKQPLAWEVSASTVDSYKTYNLKGGCVGTKQADPFSETSAAPGMRYYPNPAEGIVYIENTETSTYIRLYNIEGRVLFERSLEPGTPSTEVDLTSLAPGIYLLETDQNGERTRAKLIRK
jgi:hypothetical protein